MKRNNKLLTLAAVSLLSAASPFAAAGAYTDDLTKCLIASTTPGDKSVMVRWVFATLALHPDAAPLSNIDAAQRAQFNNQTARLFERVMTENCKTQTQAAVRNEGPAALQQSFKRFGEMATRDLLSNQQVANGLSNTAANLNLVKLMDLMP